MDGGSNDHPAIGNDKIVKSEHNPVPPTDSDIKVDTQGRCDRLCFAPTQEPFNHGSNRRRPLHSFPFDAEIWIGDLDKPGRRVWPLPHPSFTELVARARTRNPRFAVPPTVSSSSRLQHMRLQCSGDGCFLNSETPFVEYEKPSQLKRIVFDGDQEVVIYPFHIRASTGGDLKTLFTIVCRQDNGEYHFWRADGTRDDSYGLVKGSGSAANSPTSARKVNPNNTAYVKGIEARALNMRRQSGGNLSIDFDDIPLSILRKKNALKTKRPGAELMTDFDGSPVRPSKRHSSATQPRSPLANSSPGKSTATNRPSKNIAEGDKAPQQLSKQSTSGIERTPEKPKVRDQPGTPDQLQSNAIKSEDAHPLLEIKELCMLDYHLTEEGYKLLYSNGVFTVDFQGQLLVDPTSRLAFEITKEHTKHALCSHQKSTKVILSKSATYTIDQSSEDMSGGIILLEFGSQSACEKFVAQVGSFKSVDDMAIESRYNRLVEQLETCRNALYDSQNDGEALSQPVSASIDGQEATSCPLVANNTTIPPGAKATPGRGDAMPLPATPSSLASSALHHSTQVSRSATPASMSTDQEASMKKELLNLLRDTYIKYPNAQEDDKVEKMALMLKTPLLAGDEDRVKELKRELKAYLIVNHG